MVLFFNLPNRRGSHFKIEDGRINRIVGCNLTRRVENARGRRRRALFQGWSLIGLVAPIQNQFMHLIGTQALADQLDRGAHRDGDEHLNGLREDRAAHNRVWF